MNIPLDGRARTALGAVVLTALNLYVALRLFEVEYTVQMASIEGSFITLARWIREHPLELEWFPLWYGGVPFANTYPPLSHATVAAVSGLGEVSAGRAYHLVVGAAYCLGPVALYGLALRLSADRAAAFGAGALYSLVSPSALLMPRVAEDLGSLWRARRLQALAVYGEGPHITALLLIPIALWALDRALDRPRPAAALGAALAAAAVALTNWLGAFALAIAAAALPAARDDGFRARTWARAAAIGAFAYALACPWLPPSAIAALRHNAQYVAGSFPMGWEQAALGAVVLTISVAAALGLRRNIPSAGLRFALLWLIPACAVPLAAAWTGRYLMPQPERYHLEMEMEMAICLAAAFVAAVLLRRMPRPLAALVVLALLIWAARQTTVYRRHARGMIRPVAIAETIEYRVARKLAEELPGARVFATGSTQFWLNAFSDNPQLGGGVDQALVNRSLPAVRYGVVVTGDGERSAAWLRACGVQAVVVGGPNSRDAFAGNWREPTKFDGVLPEIWREGDDAIYAVPSRTRSLAVAVLPEHLPPRTPLNVEDVEPILPYVAALEEPTLPLVDLRWDGPNRGRLRAELEPRHLLSVRVSHAPGWRAEIDGRPLAVGRDALGFILLDPPCAGTCVVDLIYDGGVEATLAASVSLAASAGWLGWAVIDRRRLRRRNRNPSS